MTSLIEKRLTSCEVFIYLSQKRHFPYIPYQHYYTLHSVPTLLYITFRTNIIIHYIPYQPYYTTLFQIHNFVWESSSYFMTPPCCFLNLHFEKNARFLYLQWIAAVLEDPLPEGEFEEVLKNGIILCKLMNKLAPNSVPKFKEKVNTTFP